MIEISACGEEVTLLRDRNRDSKRQPVAVLSHFGRRDTSLRASHTRRRRRSPLPSSSHLSSSPPPTPLLPPPPAHAAFAADAFLSEKAHILLTPLGSGHYDIRHDTNGKKGHIVCERRESWINIRRSPSNDVAPIFGQEAAARWMGGGHG